MADPLRFPAPPAGGAARRSALGPAAEGLAALPAGLRVVELPFPGVIALHGRVAARERGDDAFAAAVERVVGVAPAAEVGAVRTGEDCHLLCLGSDSWLAILPSGRDEVALRQLDQALDGQDAVAVDVSDAHVVLEVSGPLARPVLAKGCPLDLHVRALPPGCCARTTLAGVEVIVQTLDDGGGLRLFLAPSVARWIAAWMQDQAAEY